MQKLLYLFIILLTGQALFTKITILFKDKHKFKTYIRYRLKRNEEEKEEKVHSGYRCYNCFTDLLKDEIEDPKNSILPRFVLAFLNILVNVSF